jgi:hypothetical protein
MKNITKSVFLSLKGKWGFTREIRNKAYAYGVATFTEWSDDILLYSEEGKLHLTEQPQKLTFQREYIYCLLKGIIKVYFAAEGKKENLFHTVNFEPIDNASIEAIGYCQCKDDFYKVTYNFSSFDEFSIINKVTGKTKDYLSITHFERIA